ncbi:GPI-anchored adhesin-like protein [Rhynchospora pubera]|uniref:GPI-anchored adhesin-like protein n=1 Tax=Rhynchospora pubera TaxID=906938 RepID=A0AAV8C8M0_9POAL|nr:GPI-anchored adhesin-like protein [Rhynchospora pubera]
MEVEKANSKSSGFFKIIDWGKKPKRKLFASLPASDKLTDGKQVIDIVSSSRSNVVEDDATVMSNIRGTSECSSSVTEEEGTMKRPPSVVARLMGLDSIPISMQSEPLSPPLQLGPQKSVELRLHKMPSSPIERFQTEIIPPKMGKTIPVTRYKPLSPIKSSNFISGRNAAQIMEVASRIIEPGLNLASTPVYDSRSLIRGNPKPLNRRLSVLGGDNLDGANGMRKTPVTINQGRKNASKINGTTNPSRSNNQKRTPVQNSRKQNIPGTKTGSQRLLNGDISRTGDASVGKNRVSNHIKGGGDSRMAKKTSSRARKFSTISEASQVTNSNNNNILVRKSERRINHNLVVESQLRSSAITKKIGTNGINTNNIVSFTFTSPVDKLHKKRVLPADLSHGGTIDGDYLGILLEQKLRELTCGSESPYRRSLNMVATKRCESELYCSMKADSGALMKEKEPFSSSGAHDMKETEGEKETIASLKEPDQANSLSPFSTLEAPPSMESCNSSESWESSKDIHNLPGMKACTSFRFNEGLEVEDETSPSESDYSLTATTDLPSSEIADTAISFGNTNIDSPEIALIREIINSINITEVCCNGFYLDEIEVKEEEGEVKISRIMLLGCVREFLEEKCKYYFGSGYRLWSQGLLFIGKLSAEKLYKEIWVEKGVDEESMVDVLVDADMSSQVGKWVNFEIESFEVGVEIEREVLDSLIDEMVADLL